MTKRRKSPGKAAKRDSPPARPRRWRRGAAVALLALACAGAAIGARRLEQHVNGEYTLQQRPVFRLVDAPDGLDERVQSQLADIEDLVWIDPALCARVAKILSENGWVRRVDSVRKRQAPIVEIRCQYRTPLAMVQGQRGYGYLVDEEGVRLPGQYEYHPALLVVRGVSGAPPPAGVVWAAPELSAALGIIRPLTREPFRPQIVAVGVQNFHGREDRRAPQIDLITDRPGGRIIWGSAPGEEMEENSAAQKLAILRSNHHDKGRADAGRLVIDISALPGRFSTPT